MFDKEPILFRRPRIFHRPIFWNWQEVERMNELNGWKKKCISFFSHYSIFLWFCLLRVCFSKCFCVSVCFCECLCAWCVCFGACGCVFVCVCAFVCLCPYLCVLVLVPVPFCMWTYVYLSLSEMVCSFLCIFYLSVNAFIKSLFQFLLSLSLPLRTQQVQVSLCDCFLICVFVLLNSSGDLLLCSFLIICNLVPLMYILQLPLISTCASYCICIFLAAFAVIFFHTKGYNQKVS